MKSVLISIQSYYVFLIIAKLLGWDIPQKKTEEVRKDFPKDAAWDRRVLVYCSKNSKSFNRIPEKYQPLMEKFLGKVVGEFVCDYVRKGRGDNAIATYYNNNQEETCLTDQELIMYANYGKPLYFWHISDLKIYDNPKELGEFKRPCDYANDCCICKRAIYEHSIPNCFTSELIFEGCDNSIMRPPQSWCYLEGI